MKTKLLVCAMMLVVCGAFAQDPPPPPVQIFWDEAVDGDYTDANKWRGGVMPGIGEPLIGEQGRFNQTGDYTISFGQGFLNDESMTLYDAASGKITFNTLGSSWIKPTGVHLRSDHTFRMSGNGGHSFNLEGTGGGNGNNLLQFELTDALMTVERDSSLITTTLQTGLFNIYDAGGDAASGVRLVFGHSGGTKHHAVWKEGSTSRIRQVDFRGNGPESIFFYEGGNHTVFGNFLLACTGSSKGEVRSLGGLLDVRNEFRMGDDTNAKGTLLVDGGTINTYRLFIALKTTSAGAVVVSSGLLDVSDRIEVASHSTAKEATILVDGGDLVVRGHTYIGHNGTGSVEVASGSWDSLHEVSIGRTATGVGTLTLSGGSFFQTNNTVKVANTAGAQGTLLVTGGEHFIRDLDVAPDGGIGYAELSDGSVTASVGMQVGNRASSTNSTLVISGGKHTVRGNVGIAVGRSGLGHMEISGGEVDSYNYVRLGYGGASYAGYDKTNANISTLRMSGTGILRVLGDTLNVTDASGNASRLVLDGGTIYAPNVRGWNGSASRGGTGYSELIADGGRVVPMQDNVFMETFDCAMLGDAGLIVDTDSGNSRINQNFIPKPGAGGRLIKTGLGTLRLNGTNTISDIEVNGGTLVLQSTNVLTGHLTVTNGAAVSLLESTGTGLTLAGITLGDASLTSGRLLLRNSDTITITEENGLNVINGRILLEDPAADGTYTLFSCADTAATLTLPDNLDIGNGISNKDYAWTVNHQSGITAITLTIDNRTQTPPTTWTGNANTQWDNPANWDAPTPAKGQRALFPGNAAHENVTITTDATTGELDFQSPAPYTLTGDTLTLDNNGRMSVVNVAQGTHHINAPLLLKRLTTIDTADTAALTLATVTGDGAILKGGLGALTLNSASNFNGGFTLQNGLLTLTTPAAFGTPSPDSERWTLAGGTLRYAGPAATDADNNRRLLLDLEDVEDARRGAEYVCVLAWAVPGEPTRYFRATTRGRILRVPRGDGGFGYDPYFLSDDLGVTFAEAAPSAKHAVSHRGRAMRQWLETLVQNPQSRE